MVGKPVMTQEDVGVTQLDHSQMNPLRMLPNRQSRLHILGDLSTLIDCPIGIVDGYGYGGLVCGKSMSLGES